MIFATAWIEWGLRVVIWVWVIGGVVWRSDGVADWGRLWPALLGVGMLAMVERRLRRHRCWVVTGGYDLGVLRDFYRADAARRFQPLPCQREAFRPEGRGGVVSVVRAAEGMPALGRSTGVDESGVDLGGAEAPVPALDLEGDPTAMPGLGAATEKSDATGLGLPSFPI